MKIYKITGEIIDTDLVENYQFEIEDRVLLETVDPSSKLRRTVGFAGLINNYVNYRDKAYSINTDVKCINEDSEIVYNVALYSPALRIDETTYVNQYTGEQVLPNEEGVYPENTITEYLFVRTYFHSNYCLLPLLFNGMKRAEPRGRYDEISM